MEIIRSLDEMRARVAAINELADEAARIPVLENVFYRPDEAEWLSDPLSADYRGRILQRYESIHGCAYDPSTKERSPYLSDAWDWRVPNIYRLGSTAILGDTMIAMGSVLRSLNCAPGARLLEYGAGEGSISLEAARSGCDVTVVDVEPHYLSIIQRRAEAAQVSIRTVQGLFGHDCGKFDRILFYEAFHHSLDHVALLPTLKDMLNPGGFIVFAGEPIIEQGSYWENAIPYPWGLRLDGLSFRAIQTYGWMELGFQEGYFREVVGRAGLDLDVRRCLETARGDCWIARA